MKSTILVLPVLFCLLPNCEPTQRPQQQVVAESKAAPIFKPNRDTATYTILPFDNELVKFSFPRAKPAQLSESELDKVDVLLARCIMKLNQSQEKEYQEALKQVPGRAISRSNYLIDLSTYQRQLLAMYNTKGEKEVWVNCFCSASKSEFSYWRKQIVFVHDGGNCFFNLKINLTTSKYYSVMVNGVA